MTDFTECDKAFTKEFPDEYAIVEHRHFREGFRACWQLLQEEIDSLKASQPVEQPTSTAQSNPLPLIGPKSGHPVSCACWVCKPANTIATPPDTSALDELLTAAKVEGMQNRWIYFSVTEPEYDSRLNAMPFLISWQSRMVTVAYLTKHGWSDGGMEGLSSNNMVAWMSLPDPALLASAHCPHCSKDTPHEHFIKDGKCLDQLAAGTPKGDEG